MIQANELRIGNWVNVPESVFGFYSYTYRVSPAFIEVRTNGVYQTFTIEEINPIPLTPEILEKAGFVHQSPNEYVKEAIVFRHQQNDLILHGFEHDYNGVILIRPQYLHQLQNLYWCLCGEELNIAL